MSLWAGLLGPTLKAALAKKRGDQEEGRSTKDRRVWAAGGRVHPSIGIKRVTSPWGEIESERATRRNATRCASKVDSRREGNAGGGTPVHRDGSQPCWFLYCNMAAVGSSLKSIALRADGIGILAYELFSPGRDAPGYKAHRVPRPWRIHTRRRSERKPFRPRSIDESWFLLRQSSNT